MPITKSSRVSQPNREIVMTEMYRNRRMPSWHVADGHCSRALIRATPLA
jgi:hypothetical protein